MEELEKINEMFEQVINNAEATFDYNYFKYTQDILDIWDYVRSKLGQPKVERFSQVDLRARRMLKWNE